MAKRYEVKTRTDSGYEKIMRLATKGSETAGTFKLPFKLLPAQIPPVLMKMSFENGPRTIEKALRPLVDELGEGAIASQLGQIKHELRMALDAAISSPVWAWKDGSRDIFDTGELKNSCVITIQDLKVTVRYTVPYAALVHNGGYIYPYGDRSRQPVYMPPRPWIDSVMFGGGPVPQFDFLAALERAF